MVRVEQGMNLHGLTPVVSSFSRLRRVPLSAGANFIPRADARGFKIGEISFEQELLRRSEVVASFPTTLHAVLGHKEKDWVGLADRPLRCRVFDAGRSFVFMVSFPREAGLSGHSLAEALRDAKPVINPSQSINEIVGDWQIITPAQQHKYPINPLEVLHDAHFALDPHFVEFEINHFPKFWRAIRAEKDHVEGRGVVPLIIWERHKKTGEAAYYCQNVGFFPDNYDTLLGQIVVADYSGELVNTLPERVTLPIDDSFMAAIEKTHPEVFNLLKKYKKRQEQYGGQINREAQVPPVVRKFAQIFLNDSPVIAGFEAMAGIPRIRPRSIILNDPLLASTLEY